jgi:hypothetical protein
MPMKTLIPYSPEDRPEWVAEGQREAESYANGHIVAIEHLVELDSGLVWPEKLAQHTHNAPLTVGYLAIRSQMPGFN